MSRLPATAVLRLACWCLCLLFVAWAGNVTPVAAERRVVASSVIAPPLRALDDLLWPTSTPEAEPTMVPTPAPSPTPTPVPSLAPIATPTPQPVPEPAQPPPRPTPRPEPEPTPAPAPPQPRTDATAAAIVTLTNQLRAQHGLPLLAVSYAIATAAQAYAETMAANDWFAHEGPDGSTLVSRVEAAGYSGWRYLAENLYRGFYGDAAERIVQSWAASPGHYSNMLGEQITEIGVGCYISGDLRWCVQDFGDR